MEFQKTEIPTTENLLKVIAEVDLLTILHYQWKLVKRKLNWWN